MDYNTTAVNLIQKMYPSEYLSNSSSTPGFSSIVELNMPLSPQGLIHVQQWLKKQALDTRCRYIFQAKDITTTYRNQLRSSSLTYFEGCLDISASCICAFCGMISICHGNTSADVTNNQTQRIHIKFLLTTLWYNVRY